MFYEKNSKQSDVMITYFCSPGNLEISLTSVTSTKKQLIFVFIDFLDYSWK